MPPLTVLVTGGSSASGVATARALAAAGHKVFTVGSDSARIGAAAHDAGHGVTPLTCDLASLAAVRELDATLRGLGVERVDGLIHLVGGWRSATGIEDQGDDDWADLESSAITTVRNVSRVFYRQLASSPTGRFAMVSSTTAAAPTAATASYAAAKAAAEAWTLAVAEGFARDQQGDGTGPAEQRSAAVVFVVKSLVDAGMRRANPGREFPGYTDVEDLATAAVGLFDQPADSLNGQRILLAK
ncbi:SDR family NAD(P)-dependent oxidoreductase [Paenarthrobacter sp. NPDC090520]|uniref:SDR family NAD(P)-dependent oxidoreductase n=1 Tax=Paenarthrobacter sp. NPDC090520 TaxID=3364382 RepID=UPI0037F54151